MRCRRRFAPPRRSRKRCAASTTRPATPCTQKQAAFYEANAEVTRLEQQLAFARESETRITQQVAQLTEQIGALAGQEAALRRRSHRGRDGDRGSGVGAREDRLRGAGGELRAAGSRAHGRRQTSAVLAEIQSQVALAEQTIRVIETKRENLGRVQAQLAGAPRATRQRARGPRGAGHRTDRRRRGSASPGNRGALLARGGLERAARCGAGAAGAPARGERRRAADGDRARRHRGARRSAVRAAGEDRAGQGQRALARRQGTRERSPALAGPRHRARMGGCARSGAARALERRRAAASRGRARLARCAGRRTGGPPRVAVYERAGDSEGCASRTPPTRCMRAYTACRRRSRASSPTGCEACAAATTSVRRFATGMRSRWANPS